MSENPPWQGKAAEDVDDLAALIHYLNIFPANVIGNSFGAIITLKLATQDPELFQMMLIHEPPLFPLLEGEPATEKTLQSVGEKIKAVVHLLKEEKNKKAAELFVETIAFGPGAWK